MVDTAALNRQATRASAFPTETSFVGDPDTALPWWGRAEDLRTLMSLEHSRKTQFLSESAESGCKGTAFF